VSTQPLVFVADDEQRITKLVSIALTDEGFRVVTAASSLTTAPRRPEATLHRRCRDARLAPIRLLAGGTDIAVQRQPDGD
jgi:DNA-binding NtrC family response regulator